MSKRNHRNSISAVEKRACSPSSFYTFPSSGTTVTAYDSVTFTWSSSACTSTSSTVDIYLYVSSQPVYEWTSVSYSAGSLTTSIYPSWWNDTTASTSSAHLIFVASDLPVALTSFPTGPTFSVEFNGTVPASATDSADGAAYTGPSVQSTTNKSNGSGGLSGGKLVAAVMMPILVIIAAVIGYVVYTRRKSSTSRKRWSQFVDSRMSVIDANGSLAHQVAQSIQHSRTQSMYSHTGVPFPGTEGGSFRASTRGPSHLRNESYFADGRRDSRISLGPEMREKRISFAASVNGASHSPRKPSQHHLHHPTSSFSAKPSHLRNQSNIDELRGDVSAALEVITGRKSIPSFHEARPSHHYAQGSHHLDAPPLPSPSTPGSTGGSANSLDPLMPPSPVRLHHDMPRMERNSKLGPDEMLRAYASNPSVNNSSASLSSASPSKKSKKKSRMNFLSMMSHSGENEGGEDPYGGMEMEGDNKQGYINFRK